jgi:hypothetical protein
MTVLNAILGGAIGWLLRPFEALPPTVGLAAVSLPTAIGILFVMKWTSPQARIAVVKREMVAGLFEVRLFSHDLRAIARAATAVVAGNARYLGMSLIPLAWMAVPLVLLGAQLQSYFGYVGLEIGRPAIVTVRMKDASTAAGASGMPSRPDLTLHDSAGLRVEGSPIWIPAARELSWRVRALDARADALRWSLGRDRTPARSISKQVQVSSLVTRYSAVRVAPGVGNQLWYPAEEPLPADLPIEAIEIGYASRAFSLFGVSLHWSVMFVLLTAGFALLLRRRFGVSF